jgi:diadenosine tetraphosphatase ApaH/serine/threonine PP2A family protein phosphatase
MRVLVLTDVHANIVALDAVLDDAGPVDAVWSLGDVVGYGPEPNACIARLCERPHLAIGGNHDWGVLGRLDLDDFNPDARAATLWTRDQLTSASREYLEALPEVIVEGEYTLAHGSPRFPIWEYLFYTATACASFAHFGTRACLVGHTHVPVVFSQAEADAHCEALAISPEALALSPDSRYIVNAGGVGQPRDGDPRAAYAILDTDSQQLAHRRVAYDVTKTQDAMRRLGLPARLISRIEFGW